MQTTIKRDFKWFSNYNHGILVLKLDDTVSAQHADAAYRLHINYQILEQQKRARCIKVIHNKAEPTSRDMSKPCKATLMSGKICSYKATCGDFCKRHKMLDLNVVKK